MHYKNGRDVKIGDWAVGISHNSNHCTVCGYVTELMPQQGPCNIKILRWRNHSFTEDGNPVTFAIGSPHNRPIEDYGDAKEFIRVDDGLRMITAVENFGKWDSHYFQSNPYTY
jgi:hypothetical protein